MLVQTQALLPSAAVSPAAPNRMAAPAGAAAETPPTIKSVLDPDDGDAAFGLYALDDGSFAFAPANLAAGASLPAGSLVLKSGEENWSPGKTRPVAIVAEGGSFQVMMKSGEGAKAKYSVQNFNANGVASGKASGVKLPELLAFEVDAKQDVTGDSAVGDVVTKVLDASDVGSRIGLYALTSGKLVIDDDSKALGERAQASAITLMAKGKAWKPGKAELVGVQATDSGYEVLLKTGAGPRTKYMYQAFDGEGKAVDKATTTTAAVLLDRELRYGQDFNGDKALGNIVAEVVDPTAPVEKRPVGPLLARSAKVGGEVFLGGKYIELGISGWGSFGTEGSKPGGFYGTSTAKIGMSADHDGFGQGRNLGVDYFMPGTKEERFAVGYSSGGVIKNNSNAALNFAKNMPTVVENISDGRTLGARVTTQWSVDANPAMKIVQEITFDQDSLWFNNRVMITNETAASWDSARYMRSFDPDNTVDQGGAYDTDNTIIGRFATEGYSAVKAQTWNDNDRLYAAFGSRSPIILLSTDPRAIASTFGFANADPYDVAAYDAPAAKDVTSRGDAGITMTWDSGPLAAGASASFDYYTSLDNREASAIVSEIYGVGLYKLKSGDFSVGKAPARGGDLLTDSVLLKKAGKTWTPGKGAEAVAVRETETGYQVTYKTGTGAKTKYMLQNFDTNGSAEGKVEALKLPAFVNLENTFEQDMNKDAYVGNRITQALDASDPGGSTGLYRLAAGGVWLSGDNLQAGADLQAGAVEITNKGKTWIAPKETPLAVRVNDTGLYEMVTRAGSGAKTKFIEYTIGASGAMAGKPRAIKPTEMADKETSYQQDLNGNGAIGR